MAEHGDEKMDAQLFEKLIYREVAPVIKYLADRVKAQDAQIQQLTTAMDSLIGGFDGAITNNRRKMLGDLISFGDDFGAGDIYKDFNGSDLKEDLIEYIIENKIPDEQLEELLETVKGNASNIYGKYQVKPTDMAVKIDAGPAAEVAPEAVGEKTAEEEPQKKEGPEESGDPVDDIYNKMMSLHRSARGKKIE